MGGGFGGGGGGFGGGPHMGGPMHFAPRGGHFANRSFRGRRDHRRAFVVGPGFGYYDDGYYGYGGCYWLRRNAFATGSPYWWDRYNACVYGY
jgi:hypothetical protein